MYVSPQKNFLVEFRGAERQSCVRNSSQKKYYYIPLPLSTN